MDGKTIAAQLRKRRENSVEVAAGKTVKFLRPPECDFVSMLTGNGGWAVTGDHVRKYTFGWDGYTEADIIGASGAGDPQPFDVDLFAEMSLDDMAMTMKIAEAILDSIVKHLNAKAAVQGN